MKHRIQGSRIGVISGPNVGSDVILVWEIILEMTNRWRCLTAIVGRLLALCFVARNNFCREL